MTFGDLLLNLTFNLERVKRVSVDIYINSNYKTSRNVQELQEEMKEEKDKGLQFCEIIKWYMPDQNIDSFAVNLKPSSALLKGKLLYKAKISFPKNDIQNKEVYVVAQDRKDAENKIGIFANKFFSVYFYNMDEVKSSTTIFEFTSQYGAEPGVYEQEKSL